MSISIFPDFFIYVCCANWLYMCAKLPSHLQGKHVDWARDLDSVDTGTTMITWYRIDGPTSTIVDRLKLDFLLTEFFFSANARSSGYSLRRGKNDPVYRETRSKTVQHLKPTYGLHPKPKTTTQQEKTQMHPQPATFSTGLLTELRNKKTW
jgi:hypothetical protein